MPSSRERDRGIAPPGLTIGRHRLPEETGAGFALAEGLRRLAEIVLGHRPIEGCKLPVDAIESFSIGLNGLLEAFAVAFLNPENGKRMAKPIVRPAPIKWRGVPAARSKRRTIGLGRLA